MKFIAFAETKDGNRLNLPDSFMPESRKANAYFDVGTKGASKSRIGIHHAWTNPHIIKTAAQILKVKPSTIRVVCIEQVVTVAN